MQLNIAPGWIDRLNHQPQHLHPMLQRRVMGLEGIVRRPNSHQVKVMGKPDQNLLMGRRWGIRAGTEESDLHHGGGGWGVGGVGEWMGGWVDGWMSR